MNKRVYGVLGVSSIMSNWNADFTGYPKTISSGETYGSDKAFKYPMKKMWDNQGEKVLYIKSMRFETDKKGTTNLIPRSLKERYEYLFDIKDLKECKDTKEVLMNLFNTTDVKNFGATFAEAGMNISITGAVQFGQGFNKYEDTDPQEQQILSPFRDASKATDEKGEAKNSTLGTKIVSDEAHYFYPVVVNPDAYNEFVKLGVTEGYTEEDFQKFKATSLVSATAFVTNSKEGCDNEFGLFIETERHSYLPNLTDYISFEKGEKQNTIYVNLNKIITGIESQVQSIEIYYNPVTTLIHCDIEGVSFYNIVTRKEV